MANRTIGGSQNLDSMDIDHYKSQQEQQSLAIWDYDESIKHTRRISPKNLIDNSDTIIGLGNEVDNIKKDLGGNPYIAFSTDWGEETEDKYPSIYDSLSDYTYPTSAEKEIRYIEADIKNLKDNFNDLKKDLGYKPAATEEAASTYHSINGDNENPNYQSAYHWLSSLEEKVVTPNYTGDPEYKTNIYTWLNYLDSRSNWPSAVSPSITKGNAYSWLNSLDTTVTDINDNFARKYWTRYWSDELRHSHDILPKPYTANYSRKNYEKDISDENQARKFYYFGLQNDGNLVLYRSKSNEHGDGPADIGSDRQWIWQSGPEYEPAIFRIIAYFYLGKAAMSDTPKNFSLSDAINRRNTGFNRDGTIKIDIPSYFSNEGEGSSDCTILAVRNKGFYNLPTYPNGSVTPAVTYLGVNYLTNKIETKITKPVSPSTTENDLQVYLKLQIILCRNSNIPDPQNYPNT